MNISQAGITLHISATFALKTLLSIGIHSPTRNTLTRLQARVEQVSEHANGTYLLNTAFLQELSESEVQHLRL